MKVVINKCFGGFGISLQAARFMAERGNELAKKEVAAYDAKKADPDSLDYFEKKHGVRWYGGGSYERNDPALVAAVETLGEDANDEYSNLRVIEIPDGTDYEIDEYDGIEHIAEKHRTWG